MCLRGSPPWSPLSGFGASPVRGQRRRPGGCLRTWPAPLSPDAPPGGERPAAEPTLRRLAGGGGGVSAGDPPAGSAPRPRARRPLRGHGARTRVRGAAGAARRRLGHFRARRRGAAASLPPPAGATAPLPRWPAPPKISGVGPRRSLAGRQRRCPTARILFSPGSPVLSGTPPARRLWDGPAPLPS